MPHSPSKLPVVFVISREWDLRGAVRAELREMGVEAMGIENAENMGRVIAAGIAPSVVVLDGAELENPGARRAVENLSSRLPVLVINSRVSPAPTVPHSEILWRPVQVKDIVERVAQILRKRKR